MNSSAQNNLRAILSGSQSGLTASLLRGITAVAEPFYAGAMLARNWMYDTGLLRVNQLAVPVISIGNLTAGGTGKTPMVRWLASRLQEQGKHVAILSRGYKSAPGQLGDEQLMLDRILNGPGLAPVVLRANPNRVLAAAQVLEEHPDVDVFLLDDAFQHRRVARAMDIVLLSAIDPFGLGHVLPRGLLREPVRGVKRADAVVITHCDQVTPVQLSEIESRVRRHHSTVPVYRAIHAPTGLRSQGLSSAMQADRRLEYLRGRKVIAFCGLGTPVVFARQLEAIGATLLDIRSFEDHHAYSAKDLQDLRAQARLLGAEMLLTTEKDWVKVVQLPNALDGELEICRLDVEMRFLGDGEEKLLEQVRAALSGKQNLVKR